MSPSGRAADVAPAAVAACCGGLGWRLGPEIAERSPALLEAAATLGACWGGFAGVRLAVLTRAAGSLGRLRRQELKRSLGRVMASGLALVLASIAGLALDGLPERPLAAAWLSALAHCAGWQFRLLRALD